MSEKQDSRLRKKLVEIFPELTETIARIEAKEAAGLILYPRRTYKECRSWKEAWVYIFHRAWLGHDDFLKSEGDKVTCVVWPVPDFNDKLVDVLGKIANRIGPDKDLLEMRLIETRVTSKGAEKLKALLPKATIKFYSREEAKTDTTLEYINTEIEWIKKLYAKKAKPEPNKICPAPAGKITSGEHWRFCPQCGHELINEKCKLRCPRCHYFMSCSDFDFAG